MRPNAIADLPGEYFRLLAAELPVLAAELSASGGADLRALEERPRRRHFPSAVLAAAVAYAKAHPTNPLHGDPAMRSLALRLGDLIADACEAGTFTQRLDHHRDTYMWLDAYRLLAGEHLPQAPEHRWFANTPRLNAVCRRPRCIHPSVFVLLVPCECLPPP
jgi:hypothetical protein